jgi:uncharacterized repeat protein (TIGR01451 family)
MGTRLLSLIATIGIVASSFASLAAPPLVAAGSAVGSFEIDGDLADGAPGEPIDWATPPPNLTSFDDPTDRQDDSFGQGSKDHEPGGWTCLQSNVPGKDNLVLGQIAVREVGGKQFVAVNYTRSAVNGDAHIDYEFNQSSTPNPACPALPARTDGDLVISFDTSNGGASLAVRAARWTFLPGSTTVGVFSPLPVGSIGTTFDGAVNIPNAIPGHKAGDFGEAVVNLTDTIGEIRCGQFASVHLKTRTSTSENAALADRTEARPLDVGDCPASSTVKTVRNVTAGGAFGPTATAGPGDVLEYRLAYANGGSGAATGVVVGDAIQAGQTFVSCSPTCSVSGAPVDAVGWTFAAVAAGASQVVTFRVQLAASFPAGSTVVSNQATFDTAEEPPGTSNTTTTTVTAAAQLVATKTVSPTSTAVGGAVSYTIRVQNLGSAAGTTTVVDDYDQAHLDPLAIAGGGSDDGDRITWAGRLVPAGTTLELTYTGTVVGAFSGPPGGNGCGGSQYPVINRVAISGGTGAENVLCVTAAAVLASSKSVSPISTGVGGTVTYTVRVTNTGSAAATATVVDDYDQAHLDPGPASGGGVDDGSTITWTNVTVAAGATVEFTYSAVVVGPFSGPTGGFGCAAGQYPVLNQVGVSGGAGSSAVLCVDAAAELTATKSVSPGVAAVGDLVTYTITVRNDGPSAGTTTVVDDYPEDHLDPSTPTGGGVDDGSGITWSGVAVPAGGSVSLTYAARVVGTFSGPSGGAPCGPGQYPVINAVTISGGMGDAATLCVSAAAQLTTTKSASPGTAAVGDLVLYTVRVTNAGDAEGRTTIVDSYDAAHLQPGAPSHGGIDDGAAITWADLVVPAGSSVTVTYTARIVGTFSGPAGGCQPATYPVVNAVTITGGAGTMHTLCVTAAPVLAAEKTVSPGTASVGDIVSYTIRITNTGTADGSTTASDDYDQASLDPATPSGGGLDDGDIIRWPNLIVPAGGEISLTYQATILTPGSGVPGSGGCASGQVPIVNSVVLVGGSGASSTLCVSGGATLHVSKVACPTQVVPGGLVTYAISFGNSGAGQANDVVLVDTIPAGTQVVDAGGGSVAGGAVTWAIGSLAPGATASRSLTLLVTAADGTTLENTVSISGAGLAPVTAAASTPVSRAGAATRGSAFGLDLELLSLPLLHEVGRVDSVAPGAPAVAADQLAILGLLGVVDVGLLTQVSRSSINDRALTVASSEVAGVNLLSGAITADVIRAVSQSSAGPAGATTSSAGSTIANLRINGVPIANVAPNTTLDVRNPLLPFQTLARVVVQEETKSAEFVGGRFTARQAVNMLHVTLLKSFLALPKGLEIVVAHADSEATYPSGLACGAAPGAVSGEAFTAFAQGSFGSPPLPIATVKAGQAVITPLGGSDSDVAAGVLVPGIVVAATAQNTASGSIVGHPNATARSRLEGLNVLAGLVTADVVDVRSTSTTSASSAQTTFGSTLANLRVLGQPVSASTGPNTTLLVSLPAGGRALVVIDERIVGGNGTTDTEGTINAVHVYLLSPLGLVTGEVIVGSAHSDAHHP